MIVFNNLVKKLWNKWWKVIFKSEIFDMLDPEKKEKYQNQLNKIIYRLTSERCIITLKSWVYVVPTDEDLKMNSIDLLEKYFYRLLKKYIIQEVWSDYYIWGIKALGFHLKDYSLPEKISIINSKVQKKIKIWNFEIHFKVLNWRKNGKKVKLYSQLEKYTEEKNIFDIRFKVASLELALLESCIITDTYEWLDTSVITKAIKKYSRVLDLQVLQEIGKIKYNMAFNRLKELSRHISKDVYKICLDVIKQNGWCFVGQGLRNI